MMMRMLEAGGVPILSDSLRKADDGNPEGYLEYERVKQLRCGDDDWLEKAEGKAVKIVSPLLKHLPANYRYHVIFMERNLAEILASQEKMLDREGEEGAGKDPEELAAVFRDHLSEVKGWLRRRENFRVIEVEYVEVVSDPVSNARRVNEFLGGELPVEEMAGVVDPKLYRERETEL